jgi:hypothetical protein
MTPYPDSDPAAGPLPEGDGGPQDAPGSRQETSVTSPDAAIPPPLDPPGGTPHPPATAAGSAATAASLLELALTELQGRRAGLLAEIAGLEQQRDRIRQEIGAHAIGQSELIANRVKGFQAYLVGALQDLAAATEQTELVVAPVVVQPSPLDQAATAAEAVAAPAVAGQFSQDDDLIRGALARYGGQPDFYADPWKLRRTLEPAGAALLEEWFLNQGGRGAQPSGGSRNRNVLVAAAAIAVLGELYGDRFQTLVLAGQPERLGEWRRGLQDCLGLEREDFGPTSGIVLFERAEALIERADRLEERGELPFIVVDAGEAAVAVPVLQFPLWLAFAATPGEIASEEDLY